MSITAQITKLEQGPWTPQVGQDINPVPADWYPHAPALNADGSASFQMYCSKPYGGVLFKQSNPLLFKPATITTSYNLRPWGSLFSFGQVIETDLKITDEAGFTFPGDFQWNIAEGWMAQTGNPWFDLGVKIPPPPPCEWTGFALTRSFDWVKRTVTLSGLVAAGVAYTPKLVAIPAVNVGWKNFMQMVDQVQLCNNANPGAYGFDLIEMGHVFG